MDTLGIDLAAEAANTAMAAVAWRVDRATVTSLVVGVDDAAIVAATLTTDSTGIDCPFGWPESFVEFVRLHRANELVAPQDSGRDWRRGLAYRRTDTQVHAVTGRWPLSVATDRIGLAAMRAVALLARIEAAGRAVDRTGSGGIAEVYPAGALRMWGLPASGYKGKAGRDERQVLVDALLSAAPWLDMGPFEGACRASDDALDAVICALVARANALDLVTRPSPEDHGHAVREGWIVLPTGPLASLPTIA